jgi:hypothetical protein
MRRMFTHGSNSLPKLYYVSKFISDEPFIIHVGGFSGISSSKLSS